MADATPEGWLLVSVSRAGAAPSLRVTVRRKLKAPGALYVQQSVCLLSDRPDVARQLRRSPTGSAARAAKRGC